MDNKTKIIIAFVSILIAFAFGRYSAPEKIKTVEVEKKVENKVTDKDKHKNTIIIEEVKPDGTKIITTRIAEDTKTNTAKTTETDKSKTTEITKSSSRTTIQALGGVKPFGDVPSIVYGGAVSRDIFGPLSIGLWGLSSGTVGSSVGISF